MDRFDFGRELCLHFSSDCPLPWIRKSTMTHFVVALGIWSTLGLGFLRVITSTSSSDARCNGFTVAIGQRWPLALLLPVNVLDDHLPLSPGMFDIVVHIFPKEIPPYPDGSVGDKRYPPKQHNNKENSLLECRYVAQIDRVQASASHSTSTKEDGVNVAKPEEPFGIVTVAIDAAAVHDDR